MPIRQPMHFLNLLEQNIQSRPNDIALKNHHYAPGWETISWRQLSQVTQNLAQFLLKLDISPQACVAIFSNNCAQWTCADIAILNVRGVVVPLYPTNTADQISYIINDAQPQLIFVDNQERYNTLVSILPQCPQLKYVVVFNKNVQLSNAEHHVYLDDCLDEIPAMLDELNRRTADRNLHDLATLIYTSGTTGEPKGVMLDHKNFASTIQQHQKVIEFNPGDISLSFLPLSHIFERGWTLFVLASGGQNIYQANTLEVQKALQKHQPHAVCVVPRFLEKLHQTINNKIEKASLAKRLCFKLAMKVAKSCQHKPNTWRMKLADKWVFSQIRHKIGSRIKLMPCGGAALDKAVADFFFAIQLPVVCGYGLTETTATVTCQRLHQQLAGSVGQPLPDVEVKIGANNEVLTRGDTVMQGYYKKESETKKAFDGGWFKTGDAGFIDDSGQLHITYRIKELMKTSNGKYISPQRIEGILIRSPLVEQIAIVADMKNYVSALIVPNFNLLKEWAHTQNITTQNPADLIKHSQVIQYIDKALISLQAELAKFERVKKFTLLPNSFSIEMGEITPTMKLRRNVIYQKYQAHIANMYNRV